MTVDDYNNGPDWVKLTTKAKKFGVSLLGFAASCAALGLLPEPWNQWVTAGITFLTAIGVYTAKNEKTP